MSGFMWLLGAAVIMLLHDKSPATATNQDIAFQT